MTQRQLLLSALLSALVLPCLSASPSVAQTCQPGEIFVFGTCIPNGIYIPPPPPVCGPNEYEAFGSCFPIENFGDGPGGFDSCLPGEELNDFGQCVSSNPCPQPWGCLPPGGGGPNPGPADDDDEQPQEPNLQDDHADGSGSNRRLPPCMNESYNFHAYEKFADQYCPGWKHLGMPSHDPNGHRVPEKCRADGPWNWIVQRAFKIRTTYRDCLHKCNSRVPGYEPVRGRCE